MESVLGIKACDNDFEVEFEIINPLDLNNIKDLRRKEILQEIKTLDQQLEVCEEKLNELNTEIDRLTNHADGIDLAIAVTSGIISGIFDSVIVGEWDFKSAKAKSNEEINNRVINFAKKDPEYQDYLKNKRHSNSELTNAISFLEGKYKLPGDGAYKEFKHLGITDSTHHLDDFCHHPTLVGLACCILVQFTGSATYKSSTGAVVKTPIEVNRYGKIVSDQTWGKFFAGIINWFFNVAQIMRNRKGHLYSDMAGSSMSAGKGNEGAGIPGSFISIAKELSELPCFADTNFSENLRKAFQNGIGTGKKQLDLGPFNSLFAGASSKMDMRTEMAISHELKRQAVPVIMNELFVRGTYFIRRFIMQMREKDSLAELDWKEILPVNNRTIVRMMTVATGTFTAIDMADAAVRSAIKSGGFTNPAFLSNMILRVNFVGIGRFAIAIVTDVGMGIKKHRLTKQRGIVLNDIISLSNTKLYYKNAELMCAYSHLYEKEADMYTEEANLWREVEATQEAMDNLYLCIEKVGAYYSKILDEMDKSFQRMENLSPEIERNNPGLIDNMLKIIRS